GAVPAPDAGAAHHQDAVSVRLHRRRDPASRRPGRGRRLPAEAVFARSAGTQGPRSDRSPPLSELPLVARARGHGDRPAIIAGEGTFTYNDVLDASARVAACLLAGRDDLAEARVAFLAPPGFHYVAIQWGIWRAGGIAIPLAVSHPPAELEYVIRDAEVETVVVHQDFAAAMQAVHLPSPVRTITTNEAVGTAPRSLLPSVAARRRAMIVYTSGTTGKPKGVVTTHANIAAQVTSLVTAWEWRAEDWILLVLPLHHVHGIINVLTCALWAGARCEMLPKFDAERVWARIADGDLTLFMAVPTIYGKLITAWEAAAPERRRAWSAGCAPPRMRLMVSGSAALPVERRQHQDRRLQGVGARGGGGAPDASGDRGVRRGRRGRSRVGRADLRRGRAARRGRADARRAAGVGQGTARALQDSARPPFGAHPAAERPGKGDEARGREALHRLSVKDLSRFRESSCDVPDRPACSASQGNVPDPRSPAASVHRNFPHRRRR